MKRTYALAATLSLALLAGSVLADGAVKSGPQPGDKLRPFAPVNVTGSEAGKKHCLVCQNGNNPVVMIFAREVSEPLTNLVKKVDEATGKHSGCNMGSFVVFTSDSEGLDKKLKEIADKEKIKNTILSIDNPAGPKGYNVAKDADVTVVLYVKKEAKANYSFKKGEMKSGDIEKIVAEITKILPEKKEKSK